MRPPIEGGLIQLRRDRRKGRIELRAEALHNRNDGNGNPCGDQAILDGGRAGFVTQEGSELRQHGASL